MMSRDQLKSQFPRTGTVQWIGLRPERRTPPTVVQEAQALEDRGLEGDRTSLKEGSRRQVTLIQGEHLDAVAAIMGLPSIEPALCRRNIVVTGINLNALKGHRIRIGQALLQLTDECHPCERMEENLGQGGYNAMNGHGGWCAIVLEPGRIATGDAISVEKAS